MERTSGTKKGLRIAVVGFFLFAALLSTGCGQNALMNPVSDTAQDQGSVLNSGQPSNPSGQPSRP